MSARRVAHHCASLYLRVRGAQPLDRRQQQLTHLGQHCPHAEENELNPVSVYAGAEIAAENGIAPLISRSRLLGRAIFANETAYSYSRLPCIDLVANNLLSHVVANGDIRIIGDDTPRHPVDPLQQNRVRIPPLRALERPDRRGNAVLHRSRGFHFEKFVISDPFGAFEKPRFTGKPLVRRRGIMLGDNAHTSPSPRLMRLLWAPARLV